MNTYQQSCQAGTTAKEQVSGLGYQAEVSIDVTNQRLKVVSYEANNYYELAENLKHLGEQKGLGKILFNCHEAGTREIEQAGFLLEGKIPGFFRGRLAYCYSYYTDEERARSKYLKEEEGILHEVTSNKETGRSNSMLPPGYELREVKEQDVDVLVNLYKGVFTSYPSPLLNPDYVRQVMREQVYFLGVFKNGVPVSAGSAEIDYTNQNAEITDLATHEQARGMGLATTVMASLAKEMEKRKLNCLYSLARAGIPGVNRALFKLGYQYHGRLLNNCHIGGRFEDMNLWVKIPC